MASKRSFLRTIDDPQAVVTPIPSGIWFPESLEIAREKYNKDIDAFASLVERARSSFDLLAMIRSPEHSPKRRMTMLKIYRRCVALIMDTETTKKLNIPTKALVTAYSETFFKSIEKLRKQFHDPSEELIAALAALLAENDFRGEQGYQLTEQFFDWFGSQFPDLSIQGPRRAGPDVELGNVFTEYTGNFPCDFVIRATRRKVLAIGFARYDSTPGGSQSQSDDRTGGNANKVDRAQRFCDSTGHQFRMIFLADGPGLTHKDSWEEACALDGAWHGNVRVVTLKLAPSRITLDWLSG
jgi:hypothetical protein